MLAGEGHDGPVRALALLKVPLEGVEVLDGALDAVTHQHGSRLAADLVAGHHLLVEMIHHDLGLQANGVIMALHITAQLLLSALGVELRVAFDLLWWASQAMELDLPLPAECWTR